LGTGNRVVQIDAGVSSQFLSALLMIAPYLPQGLRLEPTGALVSRPYLEMTVQLMRYFGAQVDWDGDNLEVQPGAYQARPLRVEADWSAASYWYSLAALAEAPDVTLRGLFAESLQGDAVLVRMMEKFGLHTAFLEDGVHITRSAPVDRNAIFEWNFLECPDIAQTLAVTCAGLGVKGLFSGLETLSIKETDRIAAIRNELKKVGVSFAKLPPHFSKKQPDQQFFLVDGKAAWSEPPSFATYGDHRMAMAFAPLALYQPIDIEHPKVVEKSYPDFWEHWKNAGFLTVDGSARGMN
jgi:3-phosphoshikimate 1-carboxyvinyltransferase